MLILLLGGARSGKSALAVQLARAQPVPVTFIATAKVTDVDMQIMSFPDMPVALTNAAVDAAFPPEPFGTQALELGVAELLVTDYMHGVQGGAMVAGDAFVKDRPVSPADVCATT